MFGLDDAVASVIGAGITGVGSYLGTSMNNAQSTKNLWDQMSANSMLMSQQTQQNWQTMDKQAGINSAAAQWAFDRSQDQLKEVQNYNTNMANTAYQRMSADMRAAGLNPILGISSGGASTPNLSANAVGAPTVSGSGTSALGVNAPQTQSALGNGIASALQGAKLFSGVKQAAAEAQNASTQTNILENQEKESAANADKARVSADMQQTLLESQAANNLASAYQQRRQAHLQEQQYENNPSGPQVSVGIPGVGQVSGTPNGVAATIKQWTSPIAPSPGYRPAPPPQRVPQQRMPAFYDNGNFAPQSLWANP